MSSPESFIVLLPFFFRCIDGVGITACRYDTVGNGFRLKSRQDDPAVIHDDDGPRLAAKGRIDEVVSVSGILDKALDWSRLRADHGYDLISHDDIAEADI